MINPRNLVRGSIWFVDLNPTVGHEQAKRRPCIVMSADSYHQGYSGLALVLPITSRQRELFWYVSLDAPESGLDKKSYVICDQIRSVSLKRFSSSCLGFVNDYTLQQIEERLKKVLYLIVKE